LTGIFHLIDNTKVNPFYITGVTVHRRNKFFILPSIRSAGFPVLPYAQDSAF